jgi:GAF domain-containing protein
MIATVATHSDRNYPALFLALDDVLEAREDGRPGEDALRHSFERSADGFGAEKAVLLLVEAGNEGRLRALASRGLAWEEVAACESGLSVPGVSSSCIREALAKRAPVLIQDPQRALGADVSEAIRLRPCSVLCAPICDPRTGEALAVLYVQNAGLHHAFGEIDRAWIEVYARALGRVMAGRR